MSRALKKSLIVLCVLSAMILVLALCACDGMVRNVKEIKIKSFTSDDTLTINGNFAAANYGERSKMIYAKSKSSYEYEKVEALGKDLEAEGYTVEKNTPDILYISKTVDNIPNRYIIAISGKEVYLSNMSATLHYSISGGLDTQIYFPFNLIRFSVHDARLANFDIYEAAAYKTHEDIDAYEEFYQSVGYETTKESDTLMVTIDKEAILTVAMETNSQGDYVRFFLSTYR